MENINDKLGISGKNEEELANKIIDFYEKHKGESSYIPINKRDKGWTELYMSETNRASKAADELINKYNKRLK